MTYVHYQPPPPQQPHPAPRSRRGGKIGLLIAIGCVVFVLLVGAVVAIVVFKANTSEAGLYQMRGEKMCDLLQAEEFEPYATEELSDDLTQPSRCPHRSGGASGHWREGVRVPRISIRTG